MGYDVSNYENVHRPYGTLEDMDSLIKGCHDRGMRLLVDLVINHTSDQHAWFKESRSSKDNSKRDWYIWRPAKVVNGQRKPPNNWASHFGGSAWEWDETTQEYYLHLFAKEQPDLNWENEQTRNAIFASAVKFWLDRGVDGFRVDTANMYSKPTEFVDAPIIDPNSPWQLYPQGFCNGPRIHEFWQELNQKVLSHYDVMTVGECPNTFHQADILMYVGASQKKMSMVFQFDICDIDKDLVSRSCKRPWTLNDLKVPTVKWQKFVEESDGWVAVFLENHDQARSISRFGSDLPAYREASGKMLAIFQATTTGTLFVYQGQEIGMVNMPREWSIMEYKAIDSQNIYRACEERHNQDRAMIDRTLDYLQQTARDHARTPVQWDDSPYAGFSANRPWMRANDNYHEINVKKQQKNPNSLLAFWKKMLRLRKEYKDIFVYGRVKAFDFDNPATFTYTKEYDGRLCLVNLNFTSQPQPVVNPLEIKTPFQLELLISSVDKVSHSMLAPYEGRVYLLEPILSN